MRRGPNRRGSGKGPPPVTEEVSPLGRTHRRIALLLATTPPEPLPLLHEWPLQLPDWAPALTKIDRWMDE